jgi:plastocyanin
LSQFKITISKQGGTIVYKQDPPGPVSVGDEIFWYNADDQPHWPGTAALQSIFLANQIAKHTSSDTFVPGPDVAGKTIGYIDTLPGNTNRPGSSIVVRPIWQINITVNAGAIAYVPAALTGVAVGDSVVWNNTDTVNAHWPALADNSTYFMDTSIQPAALSTPFVPDASGTLSYVDFLNPKAPGGTIVVGAQR